MVEKYTLLFEEDHRDVSLRDAMSLARDFGEYIWSARLATGLLGKISCTSGRTGPSGRNEVLLAWGDGGLRRLVELGFITCSVCRPEREKGFWPAVEWTVREKYGWDIGDFIDRRILPFDARRLDWETIVSLIEGMPGRLYIPKGLSSDDIAVLQERFECLNIPIPAVGWYDRNAPDRFCEYQLLAGR